jgi:tetratricopeptide (TPR) repeat protein
MEENIEPLNRLLREHLDYLCVYFSGLLYLDEGLKYNQEMLLIDAIEYFKLAYKSGINVNESIYHLTLCYFEVCDYDEALNWAKKMLVYHTDTQEICALCLMELRLFDEAVDIMLELISKVCIPKYLVTLAAIYNRFGEFELGWQYLGHAIKGDIYNPQLYFQRALVAKKIDREFKPDVKEALRLYELQGNEDGMNEVFELMAEMNIYEL